MGDIICEQCGTRNEPGVQFCVQCGAYLPWEDTKEGVLPVAAALADRPVAVPEAAPVAATTREPDPPEATPVTGSGVAPAEGAGPPAAGPRVAAIATAPATDRQRRDAGVEPVRVLVEPTALEVVPGGDEVGIDVQIYNLSPIVDAFRVTIADGPSWLSASATEVRLLPSSNENARLTLKIAAGRLVPAGLFPLVLRVQSVAHPEMIVENSIDLTVPGILTPLVLRLEPSIVRVKDSDPGQLQATVDNTEGNQPRRVTLTGRDPEGMVRFLFSPAVVDVPAGGTATAVLRIEAPAPEPGAQATRQLTISASDGADDVEAMATFVQVAAVEVPMALRVEPSLLRVRDASRGQLDITIDNRGGRRTRRIFLAGRDPERVVQFTFFPPSIDVLAGEVGRARLRVEAPPPPAGQEATRALAVLASSEGAADLEATATFVQTTSAAPVDTPVTVRLDPSVVRVRDTAVGQLEAIIDNRAGHRVRRVFLTGRDPERLVRFTFSPPSLDVLPGDIGRVRVRLEAKLPEPGQEATRSVTVLVADGGREIEAAGTFVQITSPAPVETPVALKLEPSLIRVRDSTFGQFQVIIDNRQGIRPRRVTLAGTDPERAVGFSFWPPVVDVGRGQVARANGRLDAYPPEPGREATRQFSVSASDGAKEVEADGTFIQTTSPPAPDEPMTLRLDPSIVRVRNRGGGTATLFADNRRGSRLRRVQFGGQDPERVVRFAFDPPVLDLAPGQAAGVSVRISAPRPDGGQQVTRPFTVLASDGAKDVETTGSLVQESSDRRPIWRILLTLLGGLMMIAGAFLVWNRPNGGLFAGLTLRGIDWNFSRLSVALANFDPAAPGAPPNWQQILTKDFDPLVSVGLVVALLGGVAIFGLAGSSGRLTRIAALVCAVGFAAFLITVAVAAPVTAGAPDPAVSVVFAGCVIAFVGGMFAKPR